MRFFASLCYLSTLYIKFSPAASCPSASDVVLICWLQCVSSNVACSRLHSESLELLFCFWFWESICAISHQWLPWSYDHQCWCILWPRLLMEFSFTEKLDIQWLSKKIIKKHLLHCKYRPKVDLLMSFLKKRIAKNCKRLLIRFFMSVRESMSMYVRHWRLDLCWDTI